MKRTPIPVTRFGEDVEKVGYAEVELWPTTRKVLRTIYRDPRTHDCFWYDRGGNRYYVDCPEGLE